MKGYVTKLCDIDSIGIPDEMLEVHIDKERIEKQIAALPQREKSPSINASAKSSRLRCSLPEFEGLCHCKLYYKEK